MPPPKNVKRLVRGESSKTFDSLLALSAEIPFVSPQMFSGDEFQVGGREMLPKSRFFGQCQVYVCLEFPTFWYLP